jgi:GNS1/SUR4 family
MYFYYTLSTLHIRVPNALKRTLTSLQITQFIVGGSFAALHLFVYFTPTTTLTASSTGAAPSSSASASVSYDGSSAHGKAAGMVHCLSNPGEVWAVVANVVYLTPLTYVPSLPAFLESVWLTWRSYLFVSFFVESYTKRGKTKRAAQAAAGKAANKL